MPRYDFVNDSGEREEHNVPLADLDDYTSWMANMGWRRVFNIPYVAVIPSYHEALEESHHIADTVGISSEWNDTDG